jgi:hypothetical protein
MSPTQGNQTQPSIVYGVVTHQGTITGGQTEPKMSVVVGVTTTLPELRTGPPRDVVLVGVLPFVAVIAAVLVMSRERAHGERRTHHRAGAARRRGNARRK